MESHKVDLQLRICEIFPMRNKFHWGFMILLGTAVFASAENRLFEINQFETECRASLDEPWRNIPWEISLIKAQNIAAREKKPIFIWAMDGHPLACT